MNRKQDWRSPYAQYPAMGIFALALVLCAALLPAADVDDVIKPSTANKASSAPAPAKAPNWAEILGPSQGTLPAPLDKVIWQDELDKAMEQARTENRPLFVTVRCLPCKQCSAFDKDVLEGGPELDPLLKQFVTVRLTSAKSLDLRIFPVQGYQDLDLSWWGYFLSPEGKIYGIFGGRDEVSDETRISKAALVTALKRVLAYHYDPRRVAWNLDGPAPDLSGEMQSPASLPGYAGWDAKNKRDPMTAAAGCIHCHQVAEILREPAIEAKTFDKLHDLDIWPLPENVGLKVDRDDGLKVTHVTADSPAAKAGIKTGDVLAAAGGRLLFGQADFRGVLHAAPAARGAINVVWLRDGKPVQGQLVVADGWRKTVLDWRKSVASGNIGATPGFWPLAASNGDRRAAGLTPDGMAVKAFAPNGAAKTAGLTAGQIITAVDGKSPKISGRGFLVWFVMNHEPGDSVTLSVKDGNQTRQITYTLGAR